MEHYYKASRELPEGDEAHRQTTRSLFLVSGHSRHMQLSAEHRHWAAAVSDDDDSSDEDHTTTTPETILTITVRKDGDRGRVLELVCRGGRKLSLRDPYTNNETPFLRYGVQEDAVAQKALLLEVAEALRAIAANNTWISGTLEWYPSLQDTPRLPRHKVEWGLRAAPYLEIIRKRQDKHRRSSKDHLGDSAAPSATYPVEVAAAAGGD